MTNPRVKESNDFVSNELTNQILSWAYEVAQLSQWRQKEKAWLAYGAKLKSILDSQYPDSQGSRLAQLSKAKRYVNKALKTNPESHGIEPDMVAKVKTVTGHLFTTVSAFYSDTYEEIKLANKLRVKDQNANKLAINPWAYLEYAKEVLELAHLSVTEGVSESDPDWRDVSCALALVTGRRMNEIHMTANFQEVPKPTKVAKPEPQFKLRKGDRKLTLKVLGFNPLTSDVTVSDSEQLRARVVKVPSWLKVERAVIFTGNCKGKGDKSPLRMAEENLIPTLVDAELVISGLEYLQKRGNRLAMGDASDSHKVNSRFQKSLNYRVKGRPPQPAVWDLAGPETTYHNLRAAYLLLAANEYGQDVFNSDENFGHICLCDLSQDAVKAYKKFTLVKQGS